MPTPQTGQSCFSSHHNTPLLHTISAPRQQLSYDEDVDREAGRRSRTP